MSLIYFYDQKKYSLYIAYMLNTCDKSFLSPFIRGKQCKNYIYIYLGKNLIRTNYWHLENYIVPCLRSNVIQISEIIKLIR